MKRISVTQVETETRVELLTKDGEPFIVSWNRVQTHSSEDIRHTVRVFEKDISGNWVPVPDSTTILFNWMPTTNRSRNYLRQILRENKKTA